jgi:hypothetical protein
MAAKRLEEGSEYASFDTDGDGIVSDEELQTSKELQLRVAADNQAALESSVKNLNEQIVKAETRQQEMYERVSQLQIDNAESQREVETIRKKFAKHDMTVLSLRKPGLIEKIINRGTKGVLSDLEAITNTSS